MVPLCRSCHTKVHQYATVPKKLWKPIVLTLEDDVFERLKELKGDRSWEDFLVEAGLNYVKAEEESNV